jgi:hypothetical protein
MKKYFFGILALIAGLCYLAGFGDGAAALAVTSVCGTLEGDIQGDCDNPPQGGVEDLLYLINKDDISAIVRDISNPLIVTNIVLDSGKTAFKVQGQNNSNNTRFEMVRLRFARMYNHFLSPTGLERYEELAKGKFIAIVINNFRGASGNAAIKIYGLDAGLVAQTITQDMSSADTQGAVQVGIQTDADNQVYEPHVPATLFDTDFATSLAIVEGLI